MSSNNLKKNFVYQAIYEVLVLIMPLITSPYVSRVLGADNIGIYSYMHTIANYFVLFGSLGIKNYGNREISRCRDDKKQLDNKFSEILFAHFLVSGIVIIAYIIYLVFIVSHEYKLFALIEGIYVITCFFDISWLFFGLEKFKITVTRNSVIKIISALSIFLFVNEKSDLWKYIFILAFFNFLSQIYLWEHRKKYVSICKRPINEIIKHFPQMLILFIPTIAVSLYNYMDKIMVGALSGNSQLGFYDNSEKIITVATTVIDSVGIVMLPRMSNIVAKGDTKKVKEYIYISSQAVIWISCAMAFGIAGVADIFSVIFWGNEFSRCAELVGMLAIVLPIKGFANVLRTQYMIPNRMDKEYTSSVCFGALINLLLNILLIPRYGALGAVIGTIGAESMVCLVQGVACKKYLPIKTYLFDSKIFFVFGIIMFLAIFFIGTKLQKSIFALLIQIIVGGCIYCSLSILYFVKTKNQIFYQIINKNKTAN